MQQGLPAHACESYLQELFVKENGLRTRDFLQPDLPPAEHDSPVNPGVDWSNQATANGFDQPAEANAGVSPVLLACNLRESVTCDQLFNLFSCYGNVARVKKLIGKPVRVHPFSCCCGLLTAVACAGPRTDPVLQSGLRAVRISALTRLYAARPLARDQLFQTLVHLHPTRITGIGSCSDSLVHGRRGNLPH